LVLTSNCPEEAYPQVGYDQMIARYRQTLENLFGSCAVLISGDTLQVEDYDRYGWTMFDPLKKKARRETAFLREKESAFALGANLVMGK
jgi:hypothetical protein